MCVCALCVRSAEKFVHVAMVGCDFVSGLTAACGPRSLWQGYNCGLAIFDREMSDTIQHANSLNSSFLGRGMWVGAICHRDRHESCGRLCSYKSTHTCTVVCILLCPLQVCINDKLYIQQGALLCIHTVIWWKREMCIKERRIRIKGSGTVVTTLPVADSGCQWCQHDSPSLYWSRNWRQKGLENLKLFTENLCLNGFTFCEAKYSFIFHLFSLAFKQAVHPFQRY